ncbi:Rpn family recombination-promoting nuclease/putative transposase [Desulfurispirillum indicum]|uniref:Rpn family recombination-promoting nuclease/putative transposase n=1 Tax=Desulfurispirillum indicum TaxID=936456 RepID=UPI001CFBA8FA|nr:Rpn family recombination-promoting nuclease/putative transposase [Desulfurispirillum indicum]UCZ57116.1 Rpn family recombination-promoting nuclease/putative transposase [Desulfurispirillum indicum]
MSNQHGHHNQHDSGYKLLFSNPRLVQDLLTGFVRQEWVGHMDFATLEPVKASFVSDDMRQRHDDCIWRVRFKGQWLYLYLLLEFQSSDDYFMAVRFMTYTGLLYQDIIRSEQLRRGDTLPPVLPIVIYNGTSPWSGPQDIQELINPVHPGLGRFTPRLSYFLLDEGRVSAEELAGEDTNLVRELIKLEFCSNPAEIRQCIGQLHSRLDQPEHQQIRRVFAIWLNRFLRARFRNTIIPECSELTEVNAMLAERLDAWIGDIEKQALEKGLRKGELKGELRGKLEGELHGRAQLLYLQIELRFGSVPDAVRERISHATAEELDRFAVNIFDAETAYRVVEL